jgi:DNA-binding HxlR family transcriptional regulator
VSPDARAAASSKVELPPAAALAYAGAMQEGFGQICPVAMASEVFAQRWTPLILRELLSGSRRFNEIQRGLPLVSRALLARRLRALESAGVVEAHPLPGERAREYRLTEAGQEFSAAIDCLGAWGQRWTVRVQPRNLDPGFLMWNVRRRIALERLPARRTVVRFDFGGVPAARGPRVFWLLLERARAAELCVRDPGYDVDLYVRADLAAFCGIWLGDRTYAQALAAGAVRLSGPRSLARLFPSWLMLSRFAEVARPQT